MIRESMDDVRRRLGRLSRESWIGFGSGVAVGSALALVVALDRRRWRHQAKTYAELAKRMEAEAST
eukprot:CAMPEP_0197429514 /NCGR_PEP_ID=MMETSP1170-20131217/44092_1 /TAXON_ID=54406 /ORGANISM="Sarcinochrysis sp, Strain CCMP770" /LENGTH=65 /DNA_ID=CAMNT_0042957355 /DNA_START=22 /DNA_END=216 /DNA_ORIENTATION=+